MDDDTDTSWRIYYRDDRNKMHRATGQKKRQNHQIDQDRVLTRYGAFHIVAIEMGQPLLVRSFFGGNWDTDYRFCFGNQIQNDKKHACCSDNHRNMLRSIVWDKQRICLDN